MQMFFKDASPKQNLSPDFINRATFVWHLVELVSANGAKPPADAELCLLYIAQRFIFERTII